MAAETAETTEEQKDGHEDLSECAHHWVIEAPNGSTSRGTCLKCGGVQDFQNSVPPKGWNGQRPRTVRS